MNLQQIDFDVPSDLHSAKPNWQPRRPQRSAGLIARVLLDLVLISSAFILAYFVRYALQLGAGVADENQVPLGDYWWSMVCFVGIFMAVLQFKGFYRLSRTTNLLDEAGLIASATAYAVLTMLALVFVLRPSSNSRLMYLYLYPISWILLTGERVIARWIQRRRILRGIGVRRVLVIGATDPATRIMKAITETPSLGMHLVGYLDDEIRFSEWTLPLHYRNGEAVPHLQQLRRLPIILQENRVDEVIVALPANMHEMINAVISTCYERNIEFNLVPDTFELQVNALDFQEINGVPIIGLRDNRLTGFNYAIKRLVDITLCLTFLLFAAIPMLLIALAIKLDSRGPIILRQTRIGKNGKPFMFYKFRSMYIDAEQRLEELKKFNETGGITFKMTDDPRRTKVGKFIRRTSLDELPQIFNILFGQMSFVGPRPGLERELQEYRDWHFRRLEVTPGLTGLSQVSGRSNLKFDDTARLDIYYIENWSVWLDLKILLRTIPVVLKREGAY